MEGYDGWLYNIVYSFGSRTIANQREDGRLKGPLRRERGDRGLLQGGSDRYRSFALNRKAVAGLERDHLDAKYQDILGTLLGQTGLPDPYKRREKAT
jgi:hypothetical protein